MLVIVSTGANGKPNGYYHTRENCRNLPEKKRRIPIEEARDKLGWEKCKWCSGEAEQPRPERPSLRQLIEDGEVDQDQCSG